MPGADLIHGGSGGDTVNPGADTIYGGAQRDWVEGHAGSDVIFGGKGVEFLFAGTGADTIYGGPGNDFVYLDKDGAPDTVTCGSGRDVDWGATSENTVAADGEEVHVGPPACRVMAQRVLPPVREAARC